MTIVKNQANRLEKALRADGVRITRQRKALLKVLVEAGLLEREKRGKWAWFSVRTEQLHALSSVFQIGEPGL